ncbi:MAG: transposase [Bacteroidia bacterium]|nr:transposase [Bacteroidia bacterium]
MIYTTNWIERLNRNYKRTLRMRTSMPSPESVLFLMGAVTCKRKNMVSLFINLFMRPNYFIKFEKRQIKHLDKRVL